MVPCSAEKLKRASSLIRSKLSLYITSPLSLRPFFSFPYSTFLSVYRIFLSSAATANPRSSNLPRNKCPTASDQLRILSPRTPTHLYYDKESTMTNSSKTTDTKMVSPYDSPPASPRYSYIETQQDNGLSHQSQHHSQLGEIKLIGAGPGDPDLLTMAAYKAITSWADIVLSDKLVSKEILALVTCPLFIANKDKGCQATGQQELFERATQALNQGMRVVRLKQGDPFIFGRGGEEYLFFRRLGFEPTIVPGLSSSISGPLLANIPLTHRGIASQFLVCTGTGSQDSIPEMPTYVAHRTTVFLMALHRLEALVQDLIRTGYPEELPVAIVERASAKDQRCVKATVGTVVKVVKEAGYRPPGILIAGWACDALAKDPEQLDGLTSSVASEI